MADSVSPTPTEQHRAPRVYLPDCAPRAAGGWFLGSRMPLLPAVRGSVLVTLHTVPVSPPARCCPVACEHYCTAARTYLQHSFNAARSAAAPVPRYLVRAAFNTARLLIPLCCQRQLLPTLYRCAAPLVGAHYTTGTHPTCRTMPCCYCYLPPGVPAAVGWFALPCWFARRLHYLTR